MSKMEELLRDINIEPDFDMNEFGEDIGENQKERIYQRVMNQIHAEMKEEKQITSQTIPDSMDMGTPKHQKSCTHSKMRRRILLLVAVLLLGTMTVQAAEKLEWDIYLEQSLGLDEEAKVQLEDGYTVIDESDTSQGIELRAVTAIGDKYSMYIRFDTNFLLPEGSEEAYYQFDNVDITVSSGKNDLLTKSHGATWYPYNNEGYLGMWLEITDCEDINRSYMNIAVSDLYKLSEDGEYSQEQLIAEGDWNISWKNNYKSNGKTYWRLKKVDTVQMDYIVTSIEVTPITVFVKGIELSREEKLTSPMIQIEKVIMKDGTVYEISGCSGGNSNNIWLDSYATIRELGETINPEEVESIIVDGVTIRL